MNPGKIHSTSIHKTPEARKTLVAEASQLLQATESTIGVYVGQEGMRHPVRKTLTTRMPSPESKIPETKGREDIVQSKDSQEAKHMPCSQDFCNGRGICSMEGTLRRCRCLVGYSGEFCQEAARGPATGYAVLGVLIALAAVPAVLGLFLHFRRERKFKR